METNKAIFTLIGGVPVFYIRRTSRYAVLVGYPSSLDFFFDVQRPLLSLSIFLPHFIMYRTGHGRGGPERSNHRENETARIRVKP